MARGRKPKPAHLRLIEGNRGRRPIKPELEVEASLPPAPDHLGAEARAEWDRIAPMLFNLGLLSELDLATFGAYVHAFAVWRQAVTLLKDQPLVVRSAKGNDMQNIYIGIANVAARDMLKFGSELGLTPASRTRLTARPPGGGGDPTTDRYFA